MKKKAWGILKRHPVFFCIPDKVGGSKGTWGLGVYG